jgi:anaerobic selenocysteine-containing dehydrogenase
MKNSKLKNQPGRRDFLKSTALMGGSAAFLGQLSSCRSATGMLETIGAYELAQPENMIYSTCLQCHVDCQIKVKFWDGALAKISGNPFSPQNYLPHLNMDTPLDYAARADGKLCAKGQAAVQTYYDPYRIRKVLKRKGPRGSNEFEAIPFDQFIREVAEGGQLFSGIGDSAHYPGFKEVCAVRDRDLAKQLATDAGAFAKGEMSLADFKKKHADHLDLLIDPDHPDMGPKNNGFVFQAGRIEHGRKELMKWFVNDSFGSVNAYEHTTICEQSHHIAYDHITGGKTHHMKPDLGNAEFILFWGTGAYTANFGLTPMSERVTRNKAENGMKTAVVDPRLSHDAGKADFWLPVKPGTDGALALAMIRWILENERYDQTFLRNANKAAANATGESSWTDACHLYVMHEDGSSAPLDAEQAGVGNAGLHCVSQNGELVSVDANDTSNAVQGDLFVSTKVDGKVVKSGLQLLRDSAFSRTQEQYAQITGIPTKRMAAVAKELTSHGKKAGVELYRGPVQHTDGFYAGGAVITLNLLIGNLDHKGGLSKGGSHWHEFGGKAGSIFNMGSLHPSKFAKFGPKITREGAHYEKYSWFKDDGYPAKRPWYPFTGNLYQEIIPSFAAGYPYQGQILFLHKGTPALATPAGHTVIEMLRDQKRVPLFIACDIVVGETSMYADYILPDLSYLERWGTPHVTPDVATITSKVRQPAGVPLTDEVEVDGASMPLSLEAFFFALAKEIDLPGFGANGFSDSGEFKRAEDWYLRLIANIASGDKENEQVPMADDQELAIFRAARRHLPDSVFNEARWAAHFDDQVWRRVVHVLNRGGRFAPANTAYDGSFMKKKLASMVHFHLDEIAEAKHSLTGKYFPGVVQYRGQFDAGDQPLDRKGQYPLALITYKESFGGQSRTISNYWSNIGLQPDNKVLLNRVDAERLGLEDGQMVKMTSADNPEGRVEIYQGKSIETTAQLDVREGILPGVVAVSWHYGHWAYGSQDMIIDGVEVKGDPRRAGGMCPNPVMEVDPVLKDVCLTDPIGGSASFFDSQVKIEAV